MRKREYRVPVYLTLEEKDDLQSKAQGACMDCARFIRMLISGYAPRPAPDDRFYEAMEILKEFGDKLEHLQTGVNDEELRARLEHESEKWHIFQHAIEQRYLLPERSDV